jgi:hypothetical protein
MREHAARALQHDVRGKRLASSRLAPMRSFCTSSTSTPRGRAASPGCGVASVGAPRACVAATQRGIARDQVERIRIERERESAARARA